LRRLHVVEMMGRMTETQIFAIVATVLPFIVVAALAAGFLRGVRLQSGGFGLLERRGMRRVGAPARATVLDAVLSPLGPPRDDLSEDYRVVVEIHHTEASRAERVQVSIRWRDFKWGRMGVGRELPVLVSPAFPGRVMIDYQALRRERSAAKRRQRIADEERQQALLNRDD
jgi:hypothetical protein